MYVSEQGCWKFFFEGVDLITYHIISYHISYRIISYHRAQMAEVETDKSQDAISIR